MTRYALDNPDNIPETEDNLTVGALTEALQGLDPDMPVNLMYTTDSTDEIDAFPGKIIALGTDDKQFAVVMGPRDW